MPRGPAGPAAAGADVSRPPRAARVSAGAGPWARRHRVRPAEAGRAATDVLRPQRRWHQAARDAARQAAPRAGPGLGGGARAHGRAPACRRHRLRAGAAGLRPVERHRFVDTRAGHPGLRGHQPADRPRPDDLQAVGGGAHAGAAVRIQRGPGRGSWAACSRSAPAAATRPRCCRCWRAACCRSNGCGRCTTRPGCTCTPGARRDVRLVYGDGRLGHAPWAPYDTSSPPPAATNCRRPGWTSWPSAAAWWRRCTTAPAARCWWWSTARRRLARAACRGGALRPPKIRPRMTRPRAGPSPWGPPTGQAWHEQSLMR
jgi:protein-L-isoaspartate(D-aspartate) O-methyltransferase